MSQTRNSYIICSTPRTGSTLLCSLLRATNVAGIPESYFRSQGEFIIRLAEQDEIEGIGVDLSPYCVADAEAKSQERVPEAQLTFLEMDGANYEPEEPECFDLVACIFRSATACVRVLAPRKSG